MIEFPTEAIGFHGTNRAAVPHLLAGQIEPSDQHFEWLGSGFYLWQDSPWRAEAWANDRSQIEFCPPPPTEIPGESPLAEVSPSPRRR